MKVIDNRKTEKIDFFLRFIYLKLFSISNSINSDSKLDNSKKEGEGEKNMIKRMVINIDIDTENHPPQWLKI